MGFFVVLLDQKSWISLGPFLTVGVLGGFTTFSAFSLEAFNLFQRGEPLALISYISLSILLSIFALVLGMAIGRYIIV
jgi:CrcB protein